jgi:hypothetical protein
VKDVELLDTAAHKDIKAFALRLTRNAKARLPEAVKGPGPVLTVQPRLHTIGLRQEGGLITARWSGRAVLDVDFTADGKPVARMRAEAPPSVNGYLEPAADRLLDDVIDFLLSP